MVPGSKPGLLIYLPQGCTILLDDKTLATEEIIKWFVKQIGFKST